MNEIKDIALAPSGEKKIAWVKRNMPVLRGIEADSAQDIVDTSGNFAQTHDKNQPWNNGKRIRYCTQCG